LSAFQKGRLLAFKRKPPGDPANDEADELSGHRASDCTNADSDRITHGMVIVTRYRHLPRLDP